MAVTRRRFPQAQGPVHVLLLGLILAAYLLLAGGYAAFTPAWNNPDEPAHFNYVAHIARTGTLPVLQAGDWDQDTLERLKSAQFRGEPDISSIRYEAWQPPLYYLLATPVFLAAGASPAAQVAALRWFDITLGALTLGVGYLLGRQVLCGLAPVVPAVMVGVPMFTAMSAAITNDALSNLLAALLLLLSVRVARGPTPRLALLAGVGLGLGLLTKLSLVVFVGLYAAALGIAWLQNRISFTRALRLGLLSAGLVLAVLAPYLVRQALTYGGADLLAVRRHDEVVVGQPRFPGLSLDYAQRWGGTVFRSFWAQFGWMGIPVMDRLYVGWGVLTAAAIAGTTIAVARWRGTLRAVDAALVIHALAVSAVVALLLYYNLSFEQAQGRYLFPALPAFAVLFVVGWRSLIPPRFRVGGFIILSCALIALNGYTLLRQLAPAFAG